jgi:hypothetical protein
MNFNADSFLFHAGLLYDNIFLLINHTGLMFPWTPVSFGTLDRIFIPVFLSLTPVGSTRGFPAGTCGSTKSRKV